MDLITKLKGAWYLGGTIIFGSVKYAFRRASVERRFRRNTFNKPFQIGGLHRTSELESGMMFEFENAFLEVVFVMPGVPRLTWTPGELPLNYAVSRSEFPPVQVRMAREDEYHVLESNGLIVTVKPDGSITFTHDGTLLRNDHPPRMMKAGWNTRTDMAADEAFFGMGMRSHGFNVRDGVFKMWNREPQGAYAPGDDPLYVSSPAYLSVSPRGSYLAFFDNTFQSVFSFKGRIDCQFTGGAVRYFMFAGTPEENVMRFYDLVGHPAMPPRWALGFHQCRWSYMSDAEVRQIAGGFENNDMPVSAIHMDIHYMDGYRVFTVDKARFPDLGALAAEMDGKGIRLVTILDPGVKIDDQYPLYREGCEKDLFLRVPDGSHVESLVWPGWCAFPDFSSPAAREWWADQYKFLLDQGISGFWHDMNEPAGFAAWGDHTLPTAAVHSLEGRGGSHLEAHNVYALGEAMAGFDAQKKFRPERRPWILSRSGWPGLARYAWHWTGDSESNWWSLAQTLRIAMNLAVSGIPYTGADIGGFGGRPDRELYLRWFQACSVLPFFRVHSAFFTPRREPWCFDDEVTRITREHLRRRYLLMPVWYSLAAAATRTGRTPIRPMFMEDVSMVSVDDQFMVGRALLAAPVVEKGARDRCIRFPEGNWYDFETGEFIEGGKRRCVKAPLDFMPLYAREGSIVPVDPSAGPAEGDYARIELRVFMPNADGIFPGGELFRDAGDGYGPWLLERFELASEEATTTIFRHASGDFKPACDHFVIRTIGDDETAEIKVDGVAVERTDGVFVVPATFEKIEI